MIIEKEISNCLYDCCISYNDIDYLLIDFLTKNNLYNELNVNLLKNRLNFIFRDILTELNSHYDYKPLIKKLYENARKSKLNSILNDNS